MGDARNALKYLIARCNERYDLINGDGQATVKTVLRKLCGWIQLGRVGDNDELLW